MKKLWLILVLFMTVGCWNKKPVGPIIEPTPPGTEPTYHIYTASNDGLQDLPGIQPEDVITVVTVPASTIPTTVTVVKKKKKLIRKKDEPKNPVDVYSSSQGTKAEYPEITPWWYILAYILIFIGACIAIYEYLAKKFSWAITPIKWVISFIKKRRG